MLAWHDFKKRSSLSSVCPPFILPSPPSLVPEILLARDRVFFSQPENELPGRGLWWHNGHKRLLIGTETTRALSTWGQREGTLKKGWDCEYEGGLEKKILKHWGWKKKNAEIWVINFINFKGLERGGGGGGGGRGRDGEWACYILDIFFILMKSQHFSS